MNVMQAADKTKCQLEIHWQELNASQFDSVRKAFKGRSYEIIW